MSKPKFLFVLTSQGVIPSRQTQTGWYLPELVHPCNRLDHIFDIVIASPAGGEAPLDPYSIESTSEDPGCVAFLKKKSDIWKDTVNPESLLGKTSEFAGIFYVGGHDRKYYCALYTREVKVLTWLIPLLLAMFDLANDEASHALIRKFYEAGKVVSAVCHGPAALVNFKLADGNYLIAGQKVTGLSDLEETIMQFTNDMQFLLETELCQNGGVYIKADGPFGVKVVTSGKGGKLVTGQNPPSAAVIGDALIKATGL